MLTAIALMAMHAPKALCKDLMPTLARCISVALCVFALLAPRAALALDPTRSIVQMFHRAYTHDDGLSGAVHAIAQTRDGYLWVGTDDGLYRFDGVHFEHVVDNRFLARGILALKVTSSGDMW